MVPQCFLAEAGVIVKAAKLENGAKIEASEEAPQVALCPQCGYEMVLRRRTLMNDRGYVYYWRHKNGGNLTCGKRSNYLGRKAD